MARVMSVARLAIVALMALSVTSAVIPPGDAARAGQPDASGQVGRLDLARAVPGLTRRVQAELPPALSDVGRRAQAELPSGVGGLVRHVQTGLSQVAPPVRQVQTGLSHLVPRLVRRVQTELPRTVSGVVDRLPLLRPRASSPVATVAAPAPAATSPRSSRGRPGAGSPHLSVPTAAASRRGATHGVRSSAGGATGGHSRVSRARGPVIAPARAVARVVRGLTTFAGHRRSSTARRAPRAAGNVLDSIGRDLPLPLPVPDWSKPIILLLLVLAGWFGVRSRLASRRARRLEDQRDELVGDLAALQSALVPEVPEGLGPLAVSVGYRPADGPGAGGDFYDVFALDGARTAIVLGDASGHGREALARAALMRYTLRAYVEAGLRPRLAIKLAGRVLAGEGGEEFTTVAVAVYDAAASSLTYATAGHPPPILLGQPGHDEPVTVCASPPIGWGVPTGHRQTTVALAPGAVVCFFSDGLTEARVGGQLFGRARLLDHVAALDSPPDASSLLTAVRAAADEAPDDMAACILQAGPGTEPGELRIEELELDAAELAGTRTERFPMACGVTLEEVPGALARAREIAGEHRTAVLRVTLDSAGWSTTVSPPELEGARGDPPGTSDVAEALLT